MKYLVGHFGLWWCNDELFEPRPNDNISTLSNIISIVMSNVFQPFQFLRGVIWIVDLKQYVWNQK